MAGLLFLDAVELAEQVRLRRVSLTPGGSSSGSAVAVATSYGPIATSSDGGGSIRILAAFTVDPRRLAGSRRSRRLLAQAKGKGWLSTHVSIR
jgi:hypothetical protein